MLPWQLGQIRPLDVYAPAEAGPWPVVVLFPPFDGLLEHARKVADLGFVVFVPTWGDTASGIPAVPGEAYLRATIAQGACAVEFARAHAAEYGGDPATMIVFGTSGGATTAASVAFARPAPSAGCHAAVPGRCTWGYQTGRPLARSACTAVFLSKATTQIPRPGWMPFR